MSVSNNTYFTRNRNFTLADITKTDHCEKEQDHKTWRKLFVFGSPLQSYLGRSFWHLHKPCGNTVVLSGEQFAGVDFTFRLVMNRN
jgi:hypothetical protein